MRRLVTSLLIIGGLVLMTVAYFGWTASWCNTSTSCSEPSLAYGSALFVLGVIVAFSSAIFYVVYKGDDEPESQDAPGDQVRS